MWNRNKWIRGGGKVECGSLETINIINGKGKKSSIQSKRVKLELYTTS
jgi:hypothetical protein